MVMSWRNGAGVIDCFHQNICQSRIFKMSTVHVLISPQRRDFNVGENTVSHLGTSNMQCKLLTLTLSNSLHPFPFPPQTWIYPHPASPACVSLSLFWSVHEATIFSQGWAGTGWVEGWEGWEQVCREFLWYRTPIWVKSVWKLSHIPGNPPPVCAYRARFSHKMEPSHL